MSIGDGRGRPQRGLDPPRQAKPMRLSRFIDRAIYSVAPIWGAKRMATRRKWETAEKMAALVAKHQERTLFRHWEAAEQDPSRGERWLTSRLSTNSGLELDLEEVRSRSNDLYRSDDISHGMIESLVTNVIGTSCRPKPRVPYKGFDEIIGREQARKINRQLEWLFIRWSPWAGADGTTWLEQLRLAERSLERDGDVLIVMRDVGKADKPIPLAIEVIEADRIETPPKLAGDPNVRLGVEVNPKTDEPVAYHVRTAHPGDTRRGEVEYTRIPAFDPKTGRKRACLVFERMWSGQRRGLPRLIAALNALKDRKDLKETLFINQQVAACFNVFIRTVGNPEDAAEGAKTEVRQGRRIEDLGPGEVHYLGQDEEVEFATPNPTGLDVIGQLDQQLHGIAAAANLPYAVVARNWSKFTYSGGRLELIEGRNVYRGRQQLWRELFLFHFWRQFVFEAVLLGEVAIRPADFLRHEWLYTQAAFIFSGFEWIDPQRDIAADSLAVECGFKTRSQVIAERGGDFEENVDELEWENELLEAAGLPVTMPLMNRDNAEQDPDEAERQEAAAAA